MCYYCVLVFFFGRNLQTHLEVEAFITVEDEHKATQLMSKGLH